MAKVHGHLAPFLQVLRARAGATYDYLADVVGVKLQVIHRRMHGPSGLSAAHTVDLATALGATPAELKRVRALDALDRGALPIPDGATEAQVQKAMAALEVRA